MAEHRISVIALSSCPVAGLTWRRPSGAWILTVVCRATFVLQPGRAVLSAVQHLPVAGDRGYPDGSNRGLYAPSDLVPMKPRADVLLVARDKPPARSVVARLAVGTIDKRIDLSSKDGAFVGVGPIAAGTRRPDDWQGRVVPSEIDQACFNAAPPDQQMDTIRGDERLVLENLHPAYPNLVTALPGIRPLAVVEGPGHQLEALAMRADTLWIEASQGICAVVWRGQLALDRGLPLRVLVDVDPHHEPIAPVRRAPVLQETAGVAGDQSFKQAMLPFLPGSAPAAPRVESVVGGLPFRPIEEASPPPPPAMVPVVPAPGPAQDPLDISPWAKARHGFAPRYELEETPAPARTEAPVSAAPRRPADTIQLVWFEPKSLPRVRRDARFRAILEAMDDLWPDPELDEGGDIADREDRRDLFEIFAKSEVDTDDVMQALDRSALDDGRLVQPIVQVAGELALAFDEIEVLKATISAAAPHAGSDPAVKSAVDTAQAFLAASGVGHGPAVAEVVTGRIRAALIDKKCVASAADLDTEVTRGLLDARGFQRRRLFGAPHVRAILSLDASNGREKAALPIYLEDALAAALPRTERFRVKLLAVVHPRMDAREVSPAALRPVAMAVVTRPVQP